MRFEYGRTTRYGSSTAASARAPATAASRSRSRSPACGPYTRYHFRAVATNSAGTTRSLDRSFVTPREPTGVSIALTPSRVVWGGSVTVIGRVAGTSVGGTRLALERQDFPFDAGFRQVGDTRTANSDGSFRFELPAVFVTTHLRVVTRSTVVVSSAIRTASSAVKVGATARTTSRRRARIAGTIWPLVTAGRVSLQKRSPRGRWVTVRRQARAAARRQPLALQLQREARAARRALPRRRARARRRRPRPGPQPRGTRARAAKKRR